MLNCQDYGNKAVQAVQATAKSVATRHKQRCKVYVITCLENGEVNGLPKVSKMLKVEVL